MRDIIDKMRRYVSCHPMLSMAYVHDTGTKDRRIAIGDWHLMVTTPIIMTYIIAVTMPYIVSIPIIIVLWFFMTSCMVSFNVIAMPWECDDDGLSLQEVIVRKGIRDKGYDEKKGGCDR